MALPLRRRSWLDISLNLLGVVIAGGFLIHQFLTDYIPVWVLVVGIVAFVAWLCTEVVVLGHHLIGSIPYAVMVVAGSLTGGPTNGLMLVVAAIGLLRALSDPRRPHWWGIFLALVALVLIPIGCLSIDISLTGILSLEAGIVVAYFIGYTRRQSREAEAAARELAERAAEMRDEQAKSAALAARQGIARDIHDVLAHSLGGMVIQLDAVEALLESGRVSDAQGRIHDARVLAASGLGEARRAVEALRTPVADGGVEQVPGDEISRSLAELAAAHRALGGVIELSETGDAAAVGQPLATALRRAVQEGLSNARKHAPGAPVTVRLRWQPGRVELTVSNRVAASAGGLAATGGGHGLRGMAERFEQLPGGAMSVDVRDDEFVVQVEAALS